MSIIVINSFCCWAVVKLFDDGQSILSTVATHAARNSSSSGSVLAKQHWTLDGDDSHKPGRNKALGQSCWSMHRPRPYRGCLKISQVFSTVWAKEKVKRQQITRIVNIVAMFLWKEGSIWLWKTFKCVRRKCHLRRFSSLLVPILSIASFSLSNATFESKNAKIYFADQF